MSQDPQGRKMVNIPQAMELIGVSRRTIYNWLGAGLLEYTRAAGGTIRIVEESLWSAKSNPNKGWSKSLSSSV